SGESAHHRRGRPLQVALSMVAALAVAAATFAAIRVTERGSGPSGAARTATAAPPACVVPSVEYGAGAEPAGGPDNWVASVTAGFVDCQTGQFIVDPSAPRLGPGDHDLVYLPAGGWEETASVLDDCNAPAPTDDCGWSPDGQEFAYADDSCSATPCAQGVWDAGRVHVVDATGDQTITPTGEMDRVLGWTDEGIVVAHVSTSAGVTASDGGTSVFLAGDFGASFPDYLLDPTTGRETYIGTTDAFAATGDGMWESGASNSALLRYDLATRTAAVWPVPPPGPSPSATWDDNGVVPMGFDAQGDPLIVTGDGRFIVLTGPDAAATIGAASNDYGGAVSTLEDGGVSADTPFAAVSTPGGGLLILELAHVAETTSATTFTIDTLYWDPASGLRDLGVSFSAAGAPPLQAPVGASPGSVVTPIPGPTAYPNQRWPAFAGPALTS
ncbi:MAG: hypothetical protein ABR950_07150, partial [Candidatus Dormibacteria bacterium]